MTVSRLVLVLPTAQVSGAEIVAARLAEQALARGLPVVVCAPSGRVAQAMPAGCVHVPLPSLALGPGPRAVAAAGLLPRWARAGARLRRVVRPGDLVVANALLAVPACLLGARGAPVVWLVHDVIVRPDWLALVRLVRRGLAGVVAVSDAAAAPLRARGLAVSVVRHGVAWPVAPREAEPDPPVVGCAALLTPWKGHRVLLEAFARLDPPVLLELAGGAFPRDDAYVAELRARAARPDLAGRVRFLGRVDTLEAMRRWTVAVSASTDPEAGPLVVLEAMSVGVPVVATEPGGPAELLGDDVGVLVPAGDVAALAAALRDLLADPAARSRCAARGLARVAADHRLDVAVPALLDAITTAGPTAGATAG